MSPVTRLVTAVLVWTVVPQSSDAQTREPLGGIVADVRIATLSLPTGAGWTPMVAPGVAVPSRGVAVDTGLQTFLGRGRSRRLSVGATAVVAEGRVSADDAPTLATRFTAAAPVVAMNFGHRDGWSYLSGGAGLAAVAPRVAGEPRPSANWGAVFHYGGGARWFLRTHMALSLDVRFWALTPRPGAPGRPSAAATTRVAFGAGLSFR